MVKIHIRYVSEYKLPNNHRVVTDASGGHAAIHKRSQQDGEISQQESHQVQ